MNKRKQINKVKKAAKELGKDINVYACCECSSFQSLVISSRSCEEMWLVCSDCGNIQDWSTFVVSPRQV